MQEYWNGLPCPPPGDLPNPGIEPRSPALQGVCLPSEPPGKPHEALCAMLKMGAWYQSDPGLRTDFVFINYGTSHMLTTIFTYNMW